MLEMLLIAKKFNQFQFFVRLDHIRKCFTQKGGIFILEEFSKFNIVFYRLIFILFDVILICLILF